MSSSKDSTVLFDALGPKGRKKAAVFSVVSLVVFAVLIAVAVMQLVGNGFFEPTAWADPLDALVVENTWLPALGSTLLAAALGSLFALLIGAIVGTGRVSQFLPVRGLATVYVQFFRALPVLLLIWISYTIDGEFGFSKDVLGVETDTRRLIWLVFGLAVYNGAVLAEILRSGINALSPGQAMAGQAIGLRHGQVMRSIVMPQAIRNMLPAVLAQLVILVKDTALGYVIVYNELLHAGEQIGRDYANSFLQSLLIAAFIYFVLAYALSKLVNVVERRTRRKVATIKPVTAEMPQSATI